MENLEIEIWKDIIGYEGLYKISNQGRLLALETDCPGKWGSRIKKEKILSGQKNQGYLVANLYLNKKITRIRVHRLVGISFIPNPENKPCINHKNGIRNDNRVENLEWCTYSENNIHSIRVLNKVYPQGEKCKASLLTLEQVLFIREHKKCSKTYHELSERFGVGYRTIYDVIVKRTWKHV